MNTTTLRGIFPEPKPVPRRNFMKENIRHIKEMQGLIQQQHKKTDDIKLNSQPNLSKLSKTGAPKVASNVSRPKIKYDTTATGSKRPTSLNASRIKRPPDYYAASNKKVAATAAAAGPIHRGVQTDRPEDIIKLYETGVLKYPKVGATLAAKSSAKATESPDRGRDDNDGGDQSPNLTKEIKKLSLDEKHDFVKENMNIKQRARADSPPDPTRPPPNYQKGVVPRYIKEKRDELKSATGEGEGQPGLVLLPDDERKEYLRVARDNYAALIKELNTMPVKNDTLKKRNRKIEIEEELKRLDEVIKIFQKPKVFVKADS